jgi:hypothetical protein
LRLVGSTQAEEDNDDHEIAEAIIFGRARSRISRIIHDATYAPWRPDDTIATHATLGDWAAANDTTDDATILLRSTIDRRRSPGTSSFLSLRFFMTNPHPRRAVTRILEPPPSPGQHCDDAVSISFVASREVYRAGAKGSSHPFGPLLARFNFSSSNCIPGVGTGDIGRSFAIDRAKRARATTHSKRDWSASAQEREWREREREGGRGLTVQRYAELQQRPPVPDRASLGDGVPVRHEELLVRDGYRAQRAAVGGAVGPVDVDEGEDHVVTAVPRGRRATGGGGGVEQARRC